MAKSKIIKALVNDEITIEVALNRLLVIASDLDNDELSNWAESELKGYRGNVELPPYRQKKSVFFTYSGINGSFKITNSQFTYIDIIKEHDPEAFDVPINDSVATLQNYLSNSDTQSYCRDFTYLNGYVYEETGIQCTTILQRIPLNYLQDILSEIKTRLIKVLLKLDKEYGNLDDLDVDTSDKSSEEIKKINSIVNQFVYIDNSVNIGDKNKIVDSSIN